ncbi:MAG TPA: hypothetical protein VN915_10920 [Elusimicrobiota bacterium]|nr:hypothetical protein [Elusimicrobiota bacterium]
MKSALLLAALAAALPARASAPQGGARTFAVAYGAAAFAVATDANATAERVTVRRLGLDGGVLWEQRYGTGANELPVGAAVTSWGGVSVAGDDDSGCFVAHWASNGAQKWQNSLRYGSECHVRAVLVDANGDTYVLGTTTQGGVLGPSVWKIDNRGTVDWNYSPAGPQARYAFALTLDAAGDGVTATTAMNSGGSWTYDSFDLDANGRAR